ncbi:class I SAM-dependent methyltransferase [Flavobacteriaceae bacterium S356]|uniref:Class I SAM-dependent methyltransferase n=1 Tax=Asprobacillus argus TaxID=3076534 RepID=A0ABU3LCD1_9FLAO|nr:class I SAM-dependent methyltransferase [Flavobacteriaceae bacterium S356]
MEKEIEFYCGLTPYLSCKDHLVSDESYEVMICDQYDMLVTSPVPVDLGYYYQDEAYISHTDAKKTMFDKAYQMIKSISTKRKFKLINGFSTEKRILDIGAGTGDFLSFFKSKGWEVFGVEPNEKARILSAQKEVLLKDQISEFENHQFDVITMWHVLEHIPNLSEYIRTLERLLTKNGVLIVAVPNFKSYDASHYKEFWAAYDVPRHLWHFSQASIEKLFKEVNMSVVEKHPLKFDAYYVSLLSEENKTGKKNIVSAFMNGWKSNQKAKKTSEYSSIIYVLKKK